MVNRTYLHWAVVAWAGNVPISLFFPWRQVFFFFFFFPGVTGVVYALLDLGSSFLIYQAFRLFRGRFFIIIMPHFGEPQKSRRLD